LLRVLHQVSGRRPLRLFGGYHLVLFGCGSVLRLWACGTDGHCDHGGKPLFSHHL
ncbi:hypothetical protein M9458_001712, partial [Cirrhinus mrigala]